MSKLNSSAIASSRIESKDLIITFTNGKTYKYVGAAHLNVELEQAASAGTFFNKHIKGSYKEIKL